MADPGKVSVSIRGRSAKIGTMAARLAIAAAKQNGDPIFDRYTGIRKKMGKLKHMLLKLNQRKRLNRLQSLLNLQQQQRKDISMRYTRGA